MICDLAEVYHIYDYKALQPSMVARLIFGLRDDSRLKMAISGTKYSVSELLLAHCADALNLLLWLRTDGKGKRPASIFSAFVGTGDDSEEPTGFNTVEEFERARASILER